MCLVLIRLHCTLSRSGSSRARARPLLSMTDEAATSRGVEPRMEGEAATHTHKHTRTHKHTHTHARTHTHAHTSTYTHTPGHKHKHTHTRTQTHTHTNTHTEAHKHTVTHARAHLSVKVCSRFSCFHCNHHHSYCMLVIKVAQWLLSIP